MSVVDDGVSFYVGSEDTQARSLAFKSDGTKFYIAGLNSATIYQYTLSLAWDLTTASYDTVSFSVSSEETDLASVAFNSTGTKMYVVGYDTDTVYQYTLSSAWDISTASYDTVSFSINSEDSQPMEVRFNVDGTKMYVVGLSSGSVHQYSLSSAWDLSSSSYDTVLLNVGSEDSVPMSIFFNPIGTRMYLVGWNNRRIFQYTLSSAWDLSTASYADISFGVGASPLYLSSIGFNSDGTKMYILRTSTLNIIYQYSISPTWNLGLPLRGIQITGFKKDFPITLSYNGNAVTLTPSDDSNTLAVKLQALYAADAVIGGDVGALSVTTPATCDLHYTFEVTFSLLDAAAVPSSAEVQDGTSVFTEDSLTDAIIPMGHIDGIASGRSRLVAWDEDDILYWSNANDLVDFLPSAETGANQVSVRSIKGKITKCEGFTQGFVIYATGNVVVATFSKSATSMYSFKPIEESEGLIDYRHLASAKDIHYYWSSKGLSVVTPEGQKTEFIAPELTDWIKKHRYPITMQLLSNRFLVIYLQDRDITFSNRAVRNGGSTISVGKAHADLAPVYFDYIAPGANLYPTYTRTILFDMQLQKWGSCDVANKLLISLTPYNQSGYQLAKNYQLMDAKLDNEQRELAIRLPDEYSYLATTFPTDSYILFGKYATHRDKLTKLVYVDTEYVTYPDAEIEIEKSADGAKVDFTQNISYATQTLLAKTQGFNLAGKWFNILIKGHYHLKRILVKGYTYGRKTN